MNHCCTLNNANTVSAVDSMHRELSILYHYNIQAPAHHMPTSCGENPAQQREGGHASIHQAHERSESAKGPGAVWVGEREETAQDDKRNQK